MRKERVVPLETGISWENSCNLLRLCLRIATIIQEAEKKSASGPAVDLTGL